MKELRKVKTGFFGRNLALAKMVTAFGKDFLFSSEVKVSNKLGHFLQKRMGAVHGSPVRPARRPVSRWHLSLFQQRLPWDRGASDYSDAWHFGGTTRRLQKRAHQAD